MIPVNALCKPVRETSYYQPKRPLRPAPRMAKAEVMGEQDRVIIEMLGRGCPHWLIAGTLGISESWLHGRIRRLIDAHVL